MTLTDADWRVADFRVAGTYTLRLDEGGALHLSAPPAFDDTFEAGAWTYRISGDIVTIDAFSTFSVSGHGRHLSGRAKLGAGWRSSRSTSRAPCAPRSSEADGGMGSELVVSC